jgi:ATP-dependent Lhr-like helicase
MLQGWMGHSGPVTVPGLAAQLGLDADDIESAMLRLEASGSVLRGDFERGDKDTSTFEAGRSKSVQWCDRRLLARIHRLTLGRLRREIAPVSQAEFMSWLLAWQHVAPGTTIQSDHGVLEVLRQLQGFEAPANAWERSLPTSSV